MATITQRIEMAVGAWNGTGVAATYAEQPGIATRLDTSAFDGTVTYYFEVSLRNNGTAGQTAYVELYNHTDGSSVTSSELTTVGSSGGFPLRLRSGALTLSGDKIYTARLKHSATPANTVIYDARIIVVQTGTITKTQIHQELGAETTVSSTTSTNRPIPVSEFLYEAAKYDGAVTVRHDANILTTTSNTATSGIYDETAASVVTSSEVSKSNDTNYTVLSSADITLVDGHIYQPTAYVSAGGAVIFESSKLVFTITGGFTKFLAYMLTGMPQSPDAGLKNSTSIYTNYNALATFYAQYDTGDFSGFNITTYIEARISINSAPQTVYSELEKYVYATSANSITGAVVNHTGDTNITRVRSASFAMPAGATDLILSVSASSGTNAATVYTQHLIIEATSGGVNVSDNTTVTDSSTSYSDTVFTRESYTVQVTSVNDLNVNVSDNVTASESLQRVLESFVNKSESVTLTESVTLLESVAISTFDSVTVTENLQRVLESLINKNDSVTVSEFISVFIPDLYASVSDNVSLTELLQRQLLSFISVSDNVTVTESLQRLLQSFVNVSDNVTLSESIKLLLESSINVSDTTTLSELVSIYEQERVISVSDSTTLSESIKLLLESYVNKTDSVTITEFIQLLIPILYVNVSDTITTSEFLNIILPAVGVISISVSDNVTVTEQVLRSDVPNPSCSDSTTVTEAIRVRLESSVTSSDSTSVVDTPALTLVSLINASDSVTASETTNVLLESQIRVSDNVTLTESTSATEALTISVSDTATTSEFVNELIPVLLITVSDSVTVTESRVLALTPLYVNVSDNAAVSESISVAIVVGSTYLPRLGLMGVG